MPTDLSALLRAVAVLLILVSHADIAQLQGGAHVLLAVAGYNLARFQLAAVRRGARVRGILRSALVVRCRPRAVDRRPSPSRPATTAGRRRCFLNGLTGSDRWSDDWQFWFLEALVWCYVGLAALVAVPWVDRWSRRSPFAVAVCVLAACLVVRYALVGVEAGPTQRYQAVVVLWCVALGWAVATADTPVRRLVVAAAAVVSRRRLLRRRPA